MSLGSMEQRTKGMKRQAQELIEQTYQRGYNAGYEEGKGQTWSEEVKKYEIEPEKSWKYIEQGRNEAWEAARKIYLSVYNGGLPAKEVSQIFDVGYDSSILKDFSASEAVEKLRAYEEQKEQEKQKEDEEINVGDEVILNTTNSSFKPNTKAIVITLYNDKNAMFPYNVMFEDGDTDWIVKNDINCKTGRYFPEIAEVLKKLKEE